MTFPLSLHSFFFPLHSVVSLTISVQWTHPLTQKKKKKKVNIDIFWDISYEVSPRWLFTPPISLIGGWDQTVTNFDEGPLFQSCEHRIKCTSRDRTRTVVSFVSLSFNVYDGHSSTRFPYVHNPSGLYERSQIPSTTDLSTKTFVNFPSF